MSVTADNLVWGVRRKQIVKDISFSVKTGETLGLIGPNGSGKSSLLRLLAGLKSPDSGHVTIHGDDIAALPRRELARQLAFVQQNATTDTNVSVRDVVRLGRTPHRSALSGWTAADQQAVEKAITHVGMDHLATDRAMGGKGRFRHAQLARLGRIRIGHVAGLEVAGAAGDLGDGMGDTATGAGLGGGQGHAMLPTQCAETLAERQASGVLLRNIGHCKLLEQPDAHDIPDAR